MSEFDNGSAFPTDAAWATTPTDDLPVLSPLSARIVPSARPRGPAFDRILGESPALHALLRALEAVAPTDADVLVCGESGVGKELIASAIHHASDRASGPLVKVNCASVPHELFESEFFGHVRGAFTGAVSDRPGRFAAADGGTLFLDEVGEIPLAQQGKLLRVLQEREFERVGDHRTIGVDVRVVAATNRDLREEVARGRFREDLYYRLAVFPVEVPSLRERGTDVLLLAEAFVTAVARRLGLPRIDLTELDRQRLLAYAWPGNIRELENVVERAVILGSQRGGAGLDLATALTTTPREVPAPSVRSEPAPERILTAAELRALEKRNIERALVRARGRLGGPGGAAEILGMHRSTLASRIKALEIDRYPPPEAFAPAASPGFLRA